MQFLFLHPGMHPTVLVVQVDAIAVVVVIVVAEDDAAL